MTAELIENFLTTALASSGLSITITMLLTSWSNEKLKNAIKSDYDIKLESHKAKLQSFTDTELERLKSELAVSQADRHIKFSALHLERAHVITETYALLKDFYLGVQNLIKIFVPAGDLSIEERSNVAVEAHQKFRSFYPNKEIFLPKKIALDIDKINNALVNTINIFTVNFQMPNPESHTSDWDKLQLKLETDIKTSLNQLEDEFRKLLGDDL